MPLGLSHHCWQSIPTLFPLTVPQPSTKNKFFSRGLSVIQFVAIHLCFASCLTSPLLMNVVCDSGSGWELSIEAVNFVWGHDRYRGRQRFLLLMCSAPTYDIFHFFYVWIYLSLSVSPPTNEKYIITKERTNMHRTHHTMKCETLL